MLMVYVVEKEICGSNLDGDLQRSEREIMKMREGEREGGGEEERERFTQSFTLEKPFLLGKNTGCRKI